MGQGVLEKIFPMKRSFKNMSSISDLKRPAAPKILNSLKTLMQRTAKTL